jgi:hypothetical protein
MAASSRLDCLRFDVQQYFHDRIFMADRKNRRRWQGYGNRLADPLGKLTVAA